MCYNLHVNKLVITGLFALAVCGLFAIALYAAQPNTMTAAVIDGFSDVILTPLASTTPAEVDPTLPPPLPEKVMREYVQIIEGCGPYYAGDCVNIRRGPGTEYGTISQVRIGAILRVDRAVLAADGTKWYHIVYDEWLRYPERAPRESYVAALYVRYFTDDSAVAVDVGYPAVGEKKIIVDRSDQTLSAYDGDTLFLQTDISTGLALTPTPRGTFTIYKKTPSRYMQGPLPGISDQYYDLPGVPWNLYFSAEGAVIHGVYWHDRFGERWSHGCVNVPTDTAERLYTWADIGTTVIVRE